MGRILNEMRRSCVKCVITMMTHFLVMSLGLVLTGFRSIQNRLQVYLIGTQIIIPNSKIKMKVFENIFVPKISKPGEKPSIFANIKNILEDNNENLDDVEVVSPTQGKVNKLFLFDNLLYVEATIVSSEAIDGLTDDVNQLSLGKTLFKVLRK